MIFSGSLGASIEVEDYSYNYAEINRKTVLARSINRAVRKRLEECGRKVSDSVRVDVGFFTIRVHFSSMLIDGAASQGIWHEVRLKTPPSYVGRIPNPKYFINFKSLYGDYSMPIMFSQESKS